QKTASIKTYAKQTAKKLQNKVSLNTPLQPQVDEQHIAAVQEAARLQARSFQWIHFMLNFPSDMEDGICYFPVADLQKYKLKTLNKLQEDSDKQSIKNFCNFIRMQITRYEAWQKEALQGLSYVPKRQSMPLKTLINRYKNIAQQIEKDPLVILNKKS